MVKQNDIYSSRSLSLSLLLMASSLIFKVSYAMEDTKLETPLPMEGMMITIIPKRHVMITNDLGVGKVLKIKCKSKDNHCPMVFHHLLVLDPCLVNCRSRPSQVNPVHQATPRGNPHRPWREHPGLPSLSRTVELRPRLHSLRQPTAGPS